MAPPGNISSKASSVNGDSSNAKKRQSMFRKTSSFMALARNPFCSVEDGLATLYRKTLRPLEDGAMFHVVY